jgi:ribonuclease P/MRP protein subunit RPP40
MANVAPVYKKGARSDPANYRPISLTCILCKTLEHIVSSSITKHFTKNDMFYELQHGFREKRSCQTQLLMLVDDILKSLTLKSQVDLILLDFSKAFDMVNHEKLLYKLHFYGVRGQTLKWIKAFLDNRSQSVVVSGSTSGTIPVSSGVPQGSVLGPLLFLIYINDLPDSVKHSKVRLFADDTAIYISLTVSSHSSLLQQDLHQLELWEEKWDMKFNPSKCQVLQITRRETPIPTQYILHNTTLQTVPSAKYLGITISHNLSWNEHIDNITKKANQTLGFLRRNIKVHSERLKSQAYKTLVRPQLEYSSTVWSPHTGTLIDQLESVQRRAARWVKRDFGRTSSVDNMLSSLNWRTLALRRIDQRLVMFYNIIHNQVAIPLPDYLKSNTRSSRTTHSQSFVHVPTSSDYHKFSFFPRTVIHWNALPPDLVISSGPVFSQAVSQIEHISP